ncbi:MAG: gamma-glutamylcyclotransferase [Candidatus Omnitrophica bacterium]|nr:gamma-glutamylcyclotransferase [Candidatus Omnitrophota bacterium]
MLYFAYGSNMSVKRLRARISSARVVCTAVLPGHQLKFHKHGDDGSAKCDASESAEVHEVHGVVYDIHTADKSTLDKIEGVGHGYEQKTVAVMTGIGLPMKAVTYYATKIQADLKPFAWYKEHVLRGAREHNLPDDYISLIEAVVASEDPNDGRHRKEVSIYGAPRW